MNEIKNKCMEEFVFIFWLKAEGKKFHWSLVKSCSWYFLGLPCSAFNTNDDNKKRWYRAIIKKIDKISSIEVEFVDTGLKKAVHLFDLRPLKNEYMKFSVDVRNFKNQSHLFLLIFMKKRFSNANYLE